MQAAILTGRRSKTGISVAEIDDSVDRIVAGMEGTPMVDSKSKSLVAYHEVGHAVCGTLTPGTFFDTKLLSVHLLLLSLVAYHEVGHAVCGTLTPGTFLTQNCFE